MKKIYPSIFITIVLTFIFFIIYKSYNFLGIVGIFLAFWIISNNFIIIVKKIKNYPASMIISHIGIGLLILGITGSSVWQEEKITRLKVKNQTKIKGYNILFEEINEIKCCNTRKFFNIR